MIGKTTKKLWARRLLPLAIVALALWALSLFPPVAAGLRVARVFFGNNTSRATWHSTENSAVIPFEFDRVISLPVQVNDGPVLRFALDTGSPIVALIGGAHVDALDLKIGGSLPISGAGSGATPTAYAVNGLNLKVGPLELHNQSVALIPWREMSMMFSSAEHVFIHGIVGYDLLRRYIVTIDFEREEIILHRPDEFEYNGSGVTVPMTFSQRKPYAVAIATMQDGTRVPVKLEVDLGHVLGLSLIPGSAQGIRVPDASVASEGAGLSGVVRRRLGRIRALEFGSIRLNNVVCSFSLSGYETTAERQGVLGVGMLSRFRLIMDYPGKRMILEPTAKTHEPVEVDMSGVTFWPHGDTFIAKRVRDDSPASMTGIREGDLLVHLDGTPAARLRLRDIDERLRRGDGEQTRMAIRRDGAELELVLTLRKRI